MDEYLTRIGQVLKEILELDELPASGDRVREDLGASSVEVITIVVALEEEFSTQFDGDDAELEGIETVDDIVALVNRSLSRA